MAELTQIIEILNTLSGDAYSAFLVYIAYKLLVKLMLFGIVIYVIRLIFRANNKGQDV